MIRRHKYKPYPYVFGSRPVASGLGLSGPGGLLWPLYPGVSNSMLRVKHNKIPAPMLLPAIEFDSEEVPIGSTTSVHFSFVPNLQRLIVAGSFSSAFSSFAIVYDRDRKSVV